MSENNIVPFGKYRGQPIEALISDQNYIDWALGQPDLVRRHAWLFEIIKESRVDANQDTPEHNLMMLNISKNIDKLKDNLQIEIPFLSHELEGCSGADIEIIFASKGEYANSGQRVYFESKLVFVELKPTIGDDWPAVMRQVKGFRCRSKDYRSGKGTIVQFGGQPSLLLANGGIEYVYIVIYQSFNASNMTIDEVKEMFATGNIKLLSESEIMGF